MAKKKKKSRPPNRRKADSGGLSGRWRMAMRLATLVLSPILFLLFAEFALRIAGYGLPGNFFLKWKTSNETVFLTNDRYCEHFVPKELSRSPEFSVLSPKDDSTFRIFVLGGSAAYGDPNPAFGFCRQLEVLLNEHSNGRTFEVINAAITAMNSHVAKRIAEDCATHDPDLYLVYMGNNEVVGPYGPPSLPEKLYASGAFINASIALKKETRLGQLIQNLSRSLRPASEGEKKWQGMEAFLENRVAFDDPRMKYCYRYFRENLRDIVEIGRTHGAKTIICTVPTNLRSCAPFGSEHKRGLSESQLAEWDESIQSGQALENTGDYDSALQKYQQAMRIDDAYADVYFRMAGCLEKLGRIEEAKTNYLKARDLDTLRFRADSQINATIRNLAGNGNDPAVRLLDLEKILAADSENSLLGEDRLLDHVHLNFRGNFLAAYSALKMIREIFPEANLRAPTEDREALMNLCRERLLYDGLEEYRVETTMYRRKTIPPFAGQLFHKRELERLRENIFTLRRNTFTNTFDLDQQRNALDRWPLDAYLLDRYTESLLATRKLKDAIELYEHALAAQPFNRRFRTPLAKLLTLTNEKTRAIEILTSQETPYRLTREEALYSLGTQYVQQGMFSEAHAVFNELRQIDPNNLEYQVNFAAAAAHNNDAETEKRTLDRALEISPDSTQVMINLGNYYARRNQPDKAREWFAKAVEAYPYDYLSQIGLGIQTLRLGEIEKGLEHVIQAVNLKPDFAGGYEALVLVFQKSGDPEAAAKYRELANLFRIPPRPF